MNTPSLAAIEEAAREYPHWDWHNELITDIWLRCAGGLPLGEATRAAFAWADRERRRERTGPVSLDELMSEYGDALRVAMLPCPTPARNARCNYERRAGRHATPREKERGIVEFDEAALDHLISVLRNLVERNVVTVDPLSCAIDARALDGALRRAVVAILHSATRAELAEAGIAPPDVRRGEKWLRGYAALRTDLL